MPRKTKLIIRRATREDTPAITRIESASFGRDAWERDEFLDYLAEPDTCTFLVATTDDAVVGYIIGFQTETRTEVDSVAVDPSHRGCGVAAALIARLMRLLATAWISAATLTVRLDNTAAIALYRKLGFSRERRINEYYEDAAPAWQMKMPL